MSRFPRSATHTHASHARGRAAVFRAPPFRLVSFKSSNSSLADGSVSPRPSMLRIKVSSEKKYHSYFCPAESAPVDAIGASSAAHAAAPPLPPPPCPVKVGASYMSRPAGQDEVPRSPILYLAVCDVARMLYTDFSTRLV